MKSVKTMRELEIKPSAGSSPKDFDFFHGAWKVVNRKLNSRLTNCDEWTEFESSVECKPILGGFGTFDPYSAVIDGKKFEAVTLRLFDPVSKLWSIYWADNRIVQLDVAQIGSFDGNIGEFVARDLWRGTPVIVKFKWDKADFDKPTWSQAFSADDGKTWEWNWHMTMTRKA